MRLNCFLLSGLFAVASCSTTPLPTLPPNTPLTVDGYKKAMEDRLGPLWYREVKENMSRAQIGVVHLIFDIPAAGGQVTNFRIISNTGGPLDEQFAVTAVRRLRVAPIPSAILPSIGKDHLEMEETFTISADPSPTPAPTSRREVPAAPIRA